MTRIHFIGVAGAGVSALAQFHVMSGGEATGSDRLIDQGSAAELRAGLEAAGVRIFPQDGSGLGAGTDSVVISTAVEEGNSDLARAKQLGIPVVHRADHLAHIADGFRTLAVAGTSGKSTVVAMIYEILESAGHSPSVITGGSLRCLRTRGRLGNAFRGRSDLLVIEADESDGTLTRYRPWAGVLLNLSRDHKEIAEILEMFRTFQKRSKRLIANADAPALKDFFPDSMTFGFSGGKIRGEGLRLEPTGVRFSVKGIDFSLPVIGRHNAENALAAVAVCGEVGIEPSDAARALRNYGGVARRFESVGSAGGIEVVDDYAHNPDKVKAALAAAHLKARRVLAVYQPHGFAPTRFLREDFIAAFASALGAGDILWMPDIYYAGGTAVKDISSKDLVAGVVARGRKAVYARNREKLAREIAAEAREGDLVLIMGARDPSLPEFARSLLGLLREKNPAPNGRCRGERPGPTG